jgi:glycolate oxidase FAD binding subunit
VSGAPIVTPTSIDAMVDVVREAHATARPLRIVGAERWPAAGHPVRAQTTVQCTALRGISHYTPGDLTLSCGAGTTLAELDDATRAHGQWCPLLPWGDDAGTVGATIDTATSGPFAERLGRPRQLVLGLEAVDGRAQHIAPGGRVVKNVAGFDLTRLLTGSWGTLAVLTTLHLRLRARPAVDESWWIRDGEPAKLQAFARGPHLPLAVHRTAGESKGLDGDGWLVRLGGNRAAVESAREALRGCGTLESVAAEVWDHVRRIDAPPSRALTWPWTPLAHRVRAQFDPAGILNPGLLGEVA